MNNFIKTLKLSMVALVLLSCSDSEVQDIVDKLQGFNTEFVTASNTVGSVTKKVLLIGIDGLTVSELAKVSTPHIDKLISQGAANMSSKLTKFSPTMSAPGWASILTGVWPNKHGVMGNSEEQMVNSNINAYTDIYSAIEIRDENIETYAAYKWEQFGHMIRHGSVGTLDGTSPIIREIVRGQHEDEDEKIMSHASSYLKSKQADAVLVYFEGLDQRGHAHGLGSVYHSYFSKIDGYVGELLSIIEKRDNYANEHWLICLATDHGMINVGGVATHGGFTADEMRTIYLVKDNRGFVTANKKISNGSNVDYFPTIWYHLFGEARTDLDGRVVGYRR